ncbi:succinate dehydrogenase assembly factor 4, mitochondrial [Poecile atricapillus]|uniref:succinate dehydrogenase assembly factor 4, mitochondrial n=1 Tax=Poecile atricapillus TaxID=48891 RepID=UPI00273A1828|nr:succinate dehydrogenase assembly factor 4, mitochondrial [Poecile atricapillus]
MALRLLRAAPGAASKRRAEGGRARAVPRRGSPAPLPFLSQDPASQGTGRVPPAESSLLCHSRSSSSSKPGGRSEPAKQPLKKPKLPVGRFDEPEESSMEKEPLERDVLHPLIPSLRKTSDGRAAAREKLNDTEEVQEAANRLAGLHKPCVRGKTECSVQDLCRYCGASKKPESKTAQWTEDCVILGFSSGTLDPTLTSPEHLTTYTRVEKRQFPHCKVSAVCKALFQIGARTLGEISEAKFQLWQCPIKRLQELFFPPPALAWRRRQLSRGYKVPQLHGRWQLPWLCVLEYLLPVGW